MSSVWSRLQALDDTHPDDFDPNEPGVEVPASFYKAVKHWPKGSAKGGQFMPGDHGVARPTFGGAPERAVKYGKRMDKLDAAHAVAVEHAREGRHAEAIAHLDKAAPGHGAKRPMQNYYGKLREHLGAEIAATHKDRDKPPIDELPAGRFGAMHRDYTVSPLDGHPGKHLITINRGYGTHHVEAEEHAKAVGAVRSAEHKGYVATEAQARAFADKHDDHTKTPALHDGLTVKESIDRYRERNAIKEEAPKTEAGKALDQRSAALARAREYVKSVHDEAHKAIEAGKTLRIATPTRVQLVNKTNAAALRMEGDTLVFQRGKTTEAVAFDTLAHLGAQVGVHPPGHTKKKAEDEGPVDYGKIAREQGQGHKFRADEIAGAVIARSDLDKGEIHLSTEAKGMVAEAVKAGANPRQLRGLISAAMKGRGATSGASLAAAARLLQPHEGAKPKASPTMRALTAKKPEAAPQPKAAKVETPKAASVKTPKAAPSANLAARAQATVTGNGKAKGALSKHLGEIAARRPGHVALLLDQGALKTIDVRDTTRGTVGSHVAAGMVGAGILGGGTYNAGTATLTMGKPGRGTTQEIKNTFDHEIGHGIDRAIALKTKPGRAFASDAHPEFSRTFDADLQRFERANTLLRGGVAYYAQNPTEKFAELYGSLVGDRHFGGVISQQNLRKHFKKSIASINSMLESAGLETIG